MVYTDSSVVVSATEYIQLVRCSQYFHFHTDLIMTDKPDFNGKWIFHSQENFDAFLSANEVPWLIRKAAGLSKPTCIIDQKGDEFHIQLVAMKTTEDKFTVGTEYEQTRPNGAVFLVTPKWEGDKLVCSVVPKDASQGKPQTHSRYIENDLLVLELQIGELTAKRRFKKEEAK